MRLLPSLALLAVAPAFAAPPASTALQCGQLLDAPTDVVEKGGVVYRAPGGARQ